MAVDERSSPQTGDQLRTNADKTAATDSSAACEGAAASPQPDACERLAHDIDQPMQVSGPRTSRGRRKQCRPVRVCFRDDDDNNVDDVAAIETKPPPEVNSLPEVVGLPAQNVCELCGAEETSPEALTAHASTCRGRGDPESDATGASAFPTRYHELGSELMRGSDSTLQDPADDDGPLPATSSTMPIDCSVVYCDERTRYNVQTTNTDDDSDAPLDFTLHSNQRASSTSLMSSANVDVGPSSSSVAAIIKLPTETTSSTTPLLGADAEDFCEFCQKRFCNKYYLRKHRHDVHGVTTSVETQPQQQQPHLVSSFFPQDTMPLLPLTTDALTAHDAFSTSLSTSAASAQQLPFQMTSLQPFVLPFQTSTSTSTNSLLFQSPPPAADLATSPGAAGLLPGLTSLMLLNPFASSLALLNSPSFLHQTSPAAAAAAYSASSSLNTLAELQKTNSSAAAAVGSGFGGLCDDVAALGALMNPFMPPSDPAAMDDPLSSSHNCELCRKEFCSAYFLAVHRREKHGIATSTALSDAIRLLAAGNGRPTGVLESLASGGEPGEKIPSSSTSGTGGRAGKSHSERASTHAETSRSTSSERVSNEHVCCLCDKQFPNRYGLVLHLLSAHNIRPEGFGLAGELLQLDGVSGTGRSQLTAAAASGKGGMGSGLTSGMSTTSSSSSKQSDRVSCDVCNKEVCNKYFLKTHKMKVHGLDSAAAAVYNPPPPPIDSTRSEAARSPASVSSSSRQHQQQQQHDEMRKALLMADSQFSAFASHLDFALKSAASSDPTGSAAAFGLLPPALQQQQQPGEPMMTASDIFRMFGLVGSKQDDPFLSLGPLPPPLSLHSLLPGADLCDPLTDASKHSKSVELKIPKHVAGMSHHPKDAASVGVSHQQPGRSKHSSGHHNGRHGRDQAATQPPPPPSRQSQSAVGPSEQELIQSGIDPEAYCELCQKEFCSKYFLRTHRQKIHGVSASKTDSSSTFDHYRPISQSSASANPVLQMFPGLPLPTQSIFGSGPTSLLPSTPVVEPSPDPVAMSPQSRTSAKEAANATRVTCDVCGKELCNKYFLKTHMAKIHGYTTAPCGRSLELDASETASSDASEKRVEIEDQNTPYEKCRPSSRSLPNFADHMNIPPSLSADNVLPVRTSSRNYVSESSDFQPTESTASRVTTSPELSHSTRVNLSASEPICDRTSQNDEQSLPEANDGRPAQVVAERVSPNLDEEQSSELATHCGAVGEQMLSGKRALATDADNIAKRPRTDCISAISTSAVDAVAGIEAGRSETDDDRSRDAAANSGVIQFVSRPKDPVQHLPTENSDVPTDKVSRSESSCPATSTAVSCPPASVKQSELGVCNGPWNTTINGHPETGSCQPSLAGAQQQQPPLMQPFIVRQEPSSSSPAMSEVVVGETGERTQFAACQLVLPVMRPIRDQLTVEFSVTPVSSD